ncbi:DNA polymerase III subunit beta [Halanaerobium congolense]|mgnify:CR=1 FL=1|uniref:Beta sliding clamp n=1 Tax=Halanaerobium congolense TaxID=54121 RepID=A0A1G6IL35_9FIRM|nr:DNA polymerase III subunit beta [Halanaerobium congolense]PUU92347.1 MAG: DNA polymerase III subunit beta [Halanaerobium sp.]PTX15952.1 DNA polymerase III beta subunit [Halanaerobium congolense]PXV64545.1 DNA polymerase III beta subunit [Halanaerobium congolense]TDP12274.1 DNA polymerase III beta subunit [Halanaerobium congolense]TDS33851.1 DNA polymerase III beta subunit [Halanaerobium congolense]
MKFSINQKNLYNALNIVRRAVAKNQTLPILTGIFFSLKNNTLNLKSTDLELGIEYKLEVDGQLDGSIVLPANQILNIIRELPNEEVKIELNKDKWQLQIKCINSLFKINGYDPDEFPNLPQVEESSKFNLPSSKFKEMIQKVRISTSKDETQPALTGALFEVEAEKVKMVSTNTYRLSYIEAPLKTSVNEKIAVILPGSTLQELNNLLENEGSVNIEVDSNYVRFIFAGIEVISRLIEGKFPNYELVIPDESNSKFSADLFQLHRAVKRASLIAKLDANIITLSVDQGLMEINSTEGSSGYAHEEIKIDMEGPEQKINIDAGYFIDVLKVLNSDVINIEMIGPLNPLVVKSKTEAGDKFIYLIMPVRSQS